jgi:AraC-like DNA-binding protein
MLTAQSANPDIALRPFIHWYVQRETLSKNGEIVEPVFPRAGAMLEFQFAAFYDVRAYGTEQPRPSWATTVIGPIDSHRVRLILRNHVQSLVVLFRPLGLYRLFGVPISPLTGEGTEGHAVFGTQVSGLYQRLGNMVDFADRVKVLDRFFLDRLLRSDALSPTALALRLLVSGRRTVGTAAERVGLSERQLERKSLECAGISPKTLSRISRFQHAIGRHRAGYGNWKEIAHDAGYYDQMHLVRNFRDLGGGTPTEVMKQIEDNHLISFCCRVDSGHSLRNVRDRYARSEIGRPMR